MLPYLIAILLSLGLLAGFLLLVTYEEKTGTRVVLPRRRYQLDVRVARFSYVLKHVDWGAFTNELARTGLERLTHDIAHMALMVVRALERQLTQVVRTLRARRDEPLPPPSVDRPSRLESTISLVKKTVRRSRKKPSPHVSEE